MKFTYTLTIAVLALAVSGCSGNGTTASVTSPAPTSQSPTPTPTPTPTEMSVAEAGKYYLAVICKSNKASQSMTNTVHAEPFDFAAARKATAVYRDEIRTVIQKLSAPKLKWPTVVSKDVDTFVQGLYGELGKAANASQAENADAYIADWNVWTDPAAQGTSLEASQRVRLKLNLPADAKASCKM